MKNKVKNLLLKWGNSEKDVLDMMNANFDYAVNTYSDAKPAFIANVISTLR